jgi:hypothetical protein
MKTIDALRVGDNIRYDGSQVQDLVDAGYSRFLFIAAIDQTGRLELAERGTDRVLLRRVRPESVKRGAVLEVHSWSSDCSWCQRSVPSADDGRCGHCDALFVAKRSMMMVAGGMMDISHVHPELPLVR